MFRTKGYAQGKFYHAITCDLSEKWHLTFKATAMYLHTEDGIHIYRFLFRLSSDVCVGSVLQTILAPRGFINRVMFTQ